MSAATRKWIIGSTAVGIVPFFFFIFFAIDSGTSISYLRALPVGVLLALGYFRPQVAGIALVALGFFFGGIYGATVEDLQLVPTVIIAIIFVIPLLVSGYLLIRAHQSTLPASS